MSELRLVTVVIACYNQSQFLGEAIRSVIGQAYPALEVIVVDDGSTDDTAEVAARYQQVKCVRQANLGLAGARNRGVEESRGEYVVFLDADDRLMAGALAVGAGLLDSHPECAFVYGNVRLIDANGSLLLDPPRVNIERDHYLELLRHNHIWSPGAVMYRRSVFDAVGLFDARVNASADYDLNLRIARRHPVLCHGEVVLEYRKHGSNMTRNVAEMLKTSMAVRRSHGKHAKLSRMQKAALESGIHGCAERLWREAHQGNALARGGSPVEASSARDACAAQVLPGRAGAADLAKAVPLRKQTIIREQLSEMNPQPLVSIIMIFLNAERFIQEAIESVLAQSYANWELLLINDGSTDSSGEVARQYAAIYAGKMRYLSHAGGANLGMSASRNLGINSASGELIAFLDADDVWLPEKLERQVEILRSQPAAAMVCGRTQYWYSWSGKQEDVSRDFVPELGVPPDRLVNPPALFPALMRNQVVTSTGSLLRREAIETVGGYEERFRGLFEDQAFYAKVCLKAPVFISGGCWYKYRKHPDSCCAVAENRGRHHAERLLLLNWLESYLSENAIKDKGVWQSLKRAQWSCRFPKLSRMPDHIRYRTKVTKERMKSIARRIIPTPIYGLIKARRRGRDSQPRTGAIRFGDLRRLAPFSRVFGYDRGTPVNRYYIEGFLARNSDDIRGRVLEVGDDTYARRYGGERVNKIECAACYRREPEGHDHSRPDGCGSYTF